MCKLIIIRDDKEEVVEFETKREAIEYAQLYIKENKYENYRICVVER